MGAAAIAALASAAGAQTAAPLLQPKPTFVPGLYEAESRNSAFQDQPVKSRTCIGSADFDAFRDETMAQYQKAPQFSNDCRLSDTKSFPNGFAFAMQCKGIEDSPHLSFRQGYGEQHHRNVDRGGPQIFFLDPHDDAARR